MEDGTKYTAISSNSISSFGFRIDQLIIVDDSRWKIFGKLWELIDYTTNYCLNTSCVPEEFQVQKYEYPVIW